MSLFLDCDLGGTLFCQASPTYNPPRGRADVPRVGVRTHQGNQNIRKPGEIPLNPPSFKCNCTLQYFVRPRKKKQRWGRSARGSRSLGPRLQTQPLVIPFGWPQSALISRVLGRILYKCLAQLALIEVGGTMAALENATFFSQHLKPILRWWPLAFPRMVQKQIQTPRLLF